MGYRSTNTILITSAPIEVGPQAPEQGAAAIGLSARGNAVKKVAQAGTTALGLSGSNNAVRRVAQTGVATLGLSADAPLTAVASSGAFTHVTIYRDYALATGEAPTGVVYFTPSEWMLNNAVTVVAAEVGAAISSEGQISTDLAANTDPGTSPANTHYTVREAIIGQPTRSYKVAVPYNAGLSIDLATLPVIP